MSHTLRSGLVVFVLVAADGVTVKRRCPASSLTLAAAALKPGKGEHVASQASWALGTPHALAAGVCRGCGQRPAEPGRNQQAERCAKCQPPERAKGKRAEPIASGVTPALLASLRAELDERMRAAVVPGKRGRPRSRGITTTPKGAEW